MASIYKRAQDRGKKRPCWYVAFVNHQGKRRVVKGFTDRGQTERLAAQLEEDSRLVSQGLKPAPALGQGESIESLLKTFAQHLRDRDVSEKQVGEITKRTRRVTDGCGFVYPKEMTAIGMERFLATLREEGMSKQTSNHYVKAVRQFCRWLVRKRLLQEDPTTEIRLLNVKTDRRHDRRALAADEVARVIVAAENGKPRLGVSGPDRAAMYVIAASTGFRRGEIGSLTMKSFSLTAEPPTVTVEAAHSKRRQLDTQVLPTDVAAYLVAWLSKKQPLADELLLPVSVRSGGTDRCTAKMMRHDLQMARARWLQESGTPEERTIRESSDFLVYQDSQGRFADFHATRHTFITNLSRGGVSPKTAQQLARHSDIRLTMNVYSHTDLSEKREAVQALPNILGQRGSADRSSDAAGSATDDGWERPGSARGTRIGKKGHKVSRKSPAEGTDEKPPDSSQVVDDSGLVATPQQASPDGRSTPQWARTTNLRFRRRIKFARRRSICRSRNVFSGNRLSLDQATSRLPFNRAHFSRFWHRLDPIPCRNLCQL